MSKRKKQNTLSAAEESATTGATPAVEETPAAEESATTGATPAVEETPAAEESAQIAEKEVEPSAPEPEFIPIQVYAGKFPGKVVAYQLNHGATVMDVIRLSADDISLPENYRMIEPIFERQDKFEIRLNSEKITDFEGLSRKVGNNDRILQLKFIKGN